MAVKKNKYINREISWLSFNDRVLQEANDNDVPLIERLKFLGIFSSNLDEFFRVRVATLKRLLLLKNSRDNKLDRKDIIETLNNIHDKVIIQQTKFNYIYETLIKKLKTKKIFFLNEKQINNQQIIDVKKYFKDEILNSIFPIILDNNRPFPFLRDNTVYLACKLSSSKNKSKKYALIPLPTKVKKRFFILPGKDVSTNVMFIDDVIRVNLDVIFSSFNFDTYEAFTIKLTRDAEIDIEQDVSQNILDKMKDLLKLRKKGEPVRFIYDKEMPKDLLKFFIQKLKVEKSELIPGQRYHNFKDFISFPNVGRPELEYPKLVPLPVNELSSVSSIFAQISRKDYLINLPYQSFDYIIHFLREAAIDPKVKEIKITLYRLAENSRIIHALINAAKNGKMVSCMLELKARFDEQANIYWTNRLEEEGVVVNYGMPDYKVHSKICLVRRTEKGKDRYYANLATGNYNEKTAKLYCDHSLFTANPLITSELVTFFDGLQKQVFYSAYKHLIVSPLESRQKINSLINKEIKTSKAGKNASIILKMNSLTDVAIIEKLYEASNAGVKIKLIIRGMCCLVPGIAGFSENIEVISIIDRYLEHARVWIFGEGGKQNVYLSSADMMARNLDHRVEVGFPILDAEIRSEILDIINIQLKDNTKAREINELNNNRYRKTGTKVLSRAQTDIYTYLKYKK